MPNPVSGPRPGGLTGRILAALQAGPADSVADLSRRIEKSRPSVSRALTGLLGLGYVARRGRRVEITDSGRTQLRSMLEEVPTALDKSLEDARRLAEQQRKVAATLGHFAQAVSVLPDLTGALGPSVEVALRHSELASGRLREILAPLNEASFGVFAESARKAFADVSLGAETVRSVSEAMRVSSVDAAAIRRIFTDALDMQRIQLEWLGTYRLKTNWPVAEIVAQNLIPSSCLAADLAALTPAIAQASRRAADVWIGPLVESTARVATAQQKLVRSSLTRLADPELVRGAGSTGAIGIAIRDVALPTGSTADFVGGVRSALRHRVGRSPEHDGGEVAPVEAFADPLDVVLERVHPRLAKRWQGAWHDLRGGGPNWAMDVAHAGRELLRQVLKELAPDTAVDSHGNSITRTMRVRWIVNGSSESGAEWAERIADALDQTFSLLSAEAHNERDAPRFGPEGVAGVLESLGGLIRFLTYCRFEGPPPGNQS